MILGGNSLERIKRRVCPVTCAVICKRVQNIRLAVEISTVLRTSKKQVSPSEHDVLLPMLDTGPADGEEESRLEYKRQKTYIL